MVVRPKENGAFRYKRNTKRAERPACRGKSRTQRQGSSATREAQPDSRGQNSADKSISLKVRWKSLKKSLIVSAAARYIWLTYDWYKELKILIKCSRQ